MPKKRLFTVTLGLTIGLIFLLSASFAFSAGDFKVKKTSFEPPKKQYAEGEIIVKFKAGVKSADIIRIHTTNGSSEIYTSPLAGFQRIRIPSTMTVEEMVARFRANPEVEYAEPNYIYHAFMTPNDPYYSYQWHMPSINVEPAWDLSTGQGVLVGIIDTGVAYENYGSYGLAPDLEGTPFVQGYDFVNNDSHANDDEGHGTHVTGTVTQTTNNGLGVAGVAFNCSIMPIKVLDSGGSGYVSDIADGIYYAADHGCKVINMSLGGSSSSSTLQNAVQYAYNQGVTIVCAAGNAGTSSPQYPAAYSQCISVTAVRYDNTLAYYSSYGSTVDITAPGGDVNVDQNGDGYGDGVLQQTFEAPNYTDWGYWFYQGTSMASPHVAGVAAMVIAAAGGSLTPQEVRDYLEDTATDLGSSGWDQYFGWGKVNAYQAVLAVEEPGNPPVADFSGWPTSGDAPLTVDFTDQSTGSPTSWSWNFGDGGTSTAQNPSHTYAAGTYTVSLTATNAYGSDTETKTNYITVTEPGGNYASLPYTTGFESGALDQFWTTATTGDGRVRVLSSYAPHSGSYHLCMDDATSGGYSQTEAWLHVDLAGKGDVDLEFWWKEFGDETHSQDGVYFSDNGGASFAKVQDLNGGSYSNQTWNNFILDVDELAASAGLSLTGTFVIKFQQYDNYPMTSDGFAFDDISITEAAPEPPVAAFVGDPTSGIAPLTVDFTDQSTGNPTSWSWSFGDDGTSAAQNPSHTYNNAGTYTVSLTVSNAYGSDTETKTNYITVTEPSADVMHVHSISVTRQAFWTYARGRATITIRDQSGGPVASATVYGNFTGPNSGSRSGTTNSSGQVTLTTGWQRNPSGEWCFEVTNVTKSNWTYDPNANEVTKSCESGDVYGVTASERITPEEFHLFQNFPNPFNPTTEIVFALPEASHVTLEVFNVKGERVCVLANRSFEAGLHFVSWNASGVASGVYLYRLKAGQFIQTKRMVLLK